MSSGWERIPLSETQDRRRRLTSEKKDEIREKYATGCYTMRELADEYNVSKKSILLIVNPESKKKHDEYIKAHWEQYKPDKEERKRIFRRHIEYKKRLYLKGELKKE